MGNELQTNRYDQLLRRIGGIIGPGSKVSEALSELFPVLDVERVPGELLWLSGWRLASGGGSISPAVTDTAAFQLFNPVGSGVIAVLESVQVASAATSSVNSTPTITAFVSQPGVNSLRDLRTGIVQSVCKIGTLSQVAPVSAHTSFRVSSNVAVTIEPPHGIAILTPGTGWDIGLTSLDTDMNTSFYWRERVAEPAELLFT